MLSSCRTLSALQTTFSRISLTHNLNQIREKNYLQQTRLRNPFWFVRKQRTVHDDLITPENSEFVKEIITNTYGKTATTAGVSLRVSTDLIKGDELPKVQWQPNFRRTGVIAKKIGQYPLWKKDGTKIYTTLLQIVDNHVVKYIPPEEFKPTQPTKVRYEKKFGCLMVGAESTDPSLLTKEYCGLFRDSGVMPKKILSRFIVSPEAALLPGTPLNVSHFRVGDFVDVRGKTVDRGFQGVMKRHGFSGMPASHGVTKTHRRGGNIGAGGGKARVWPGTKMPGHMGNRYRVLRGLRIWRVNTKYNVMWVQGLGIAGETNNYVYVFDSLLPLRKNKTAPPFPTHLADDSLVEDGAEDVWHEDIHNFKDHPSIFYQDSA